MARGAVAQQFAPNARLDLYFRGAVQAIESAGFRIKESSVQGGRGYARAIWGSKAKAFFVGRLLPFGKLFKSGKRLGLEFHAVQHPTGVAVQVLVVPYMELINAPERFLLSQGVLEKLTDDDFSRAKLGEVMTRLGSIPVAPPSVPDAVATRAPSVGPTTSMPVGPSTFAPPPKRHGWTWGIAVLLVLGIAAYMVRNPTLAVTVLDGRSGTAAFLVVFPFMGGLLSRSGGRGAVTGFLAGFAPLFVISLTILLAVAGVLPDGSANPFVGLLLVTGVVALFLAFALGVAAAIPGAIGGWIGGRLYPLRRRWTGFAQT